MKLTDLTEGHVQHIFGLWEKHFLGLPDYVRAREIVDTIKRIQGGERNLEFGLNDGYRFGSKWTGNSKLRFRTDYRIGETQITFSANMGEGDIGFGEATIKFNDNLDRNDPLLEEAKKYLAL